MLLNLFVGNDIGWADDMGTPDEENDEDHNSEFDRYYDYGDGYYGDGSGGNFVSTDTDLGQGHPLTSALILLHNNQARCV
jgi:hypothetical protein